MMYQFFSCWIVTALILSSQTLFAGTVEKVNETTGAVVLTLSEGETYSKGDKVCFYDSSGKKAACGKISKATSKKAIAKVSKKSAPKVAVGMTTDSSGGGASEGTAVDKAHKLAFRLLYLPTPMMPVVFNSLAYQELTAAQEKEGKYTDKDFFLADAAVKSSFLGFGFDSTIPLGSAIALQPGFRYRKIASFTVEDNYVAVTKIDTDPYLLMIHDMSAIGFWFDVIFAKAVFSEKTRMLFGSGIDIDQSTVNVKSTINTDTPAVSTDAHTITSKLTVASLRLHGGLDYIFMGPVGLHFGSTIMVPLASFGKSFSADFSGDKHLTNNTNAMTNAEEALGHKKATVGLELSIGLAASF